MDTITLRDIGKLILELDDHLVENLNDIERLLIQEKSILSDLLRSIKMDLEVTNGLLSKRIGSS